MRLRHFIQFPGSEITPPCVSSCGDGAVVTISCTGSTSVRFKLNARASVANTIFIDVSSGAAPVIDNTVYWDLGNRDNWGLSDISQSFDIPMAGNFNIYLRSRSPGLRFDEIHMFQSSPSVCSWTTTTTPGPIDFPLLTGSPIAPLTAMPGGADFTRFSTSSLYIQKFYIDPSDKL